MTEETALTTSDQFVSQFEGEFYSVSLPEFEGPLDLLLHLVKKHELNIVDIPISFVTEKYLAHLELMRLLNIDVAGEYLLMAATLAHIKSRQLLPQNPFDDEQDVTEETGDPRAELIRRLLEYQRYKEAAAQLAQRPLLGGTVYPRGAAIESDETEIAPLKEFSTIELVSALAKIIERTKVDLSYDIVVDRMSTTDRLNYLVDRLANVETLTFYECFFDQENKTTRDTIVVTFLAILELARLKMIRLFQSEDSGEFYLTRTQGLERTNDVADQVTE